MIITDAHQHFWTKDVIVNLFQKLQVPLDDVRVLIRDFDPSDLKPFLDKFGVRQTVAVQVNSTLANTHYFLNLADRTPWIGGVVGWVDLTDPKVGDTLDSLRHPKLVGIRHQWHDEPDPAWIVRDDVVRGLRELAKRGLRYDLLAKSFNWEYLPKVAEVVPDLQLVIDHIAKPNIAAGQFDDWAAAMAAAARMPQMYCKVSGMITEADPKDWKPADLKPYVEKVIELFGPHRVMFGSDWPVCLLAGTYDRVFEALQVCLSGFNEQEKAMVLGENARRFYGITEA